MTSKRRTASFALLDWRCPTRCQRALPCTSGFLSRASCTRFSPSSDAPAAIASSTAAAGKVFETATSVTSPRLRPTRMQAATMRRSTATRLSRIDTAPLDPAAVGAVDGQVGQAVRVLVAGAQRVADGKAVEPASHGARLLVQRNQVRMLDPVFAQHLLHQQQ